MINPELYFVLDFLFCYRKFSHAGTNIVFRWKLIQEQLHFGIRIFARSRRKFVRTKERVNYYIFKGFSWKPRYANRVQPRQVFTVVQTPDIRVLSIPDNWRHELSKSRVLACELIFPWTNDVADNQSGAGSALWNGMEQDRGQVREGGKGEDARERFLLMEENVLRVT